MDMEWGAAICILSRSNEVGRFLSFNGLKVCACHRCMTVSLSSIGILPVPGPPGK